MTEITMAELARRMGRVESLGVHKDVYERDMKEIRDDIHEIKDSARWAMRLVAAQFLTMIVALMIWVVTNWSPG